MSLQTTTGLYPDGGTLMPSVGELQELAMSEARTVSLYTRHADARQFTRDVSAALGRMEGAGGLVVQLEHVASVIADLGLPAEYPFALAVFLRESGISIFTTARDMDSLAVLGPRPYLVPVAGTPAIPTAGVVVALSRNGVEVVSADIGLPPRRLNPPGLPRDLNSALRLDVTGDRSTLARLEVAVDQHTRDAEYCMMIDSALRAVLEQMRPHPLLVIAGAEPLAGIFRHITRYAHVAATGIHGNLHGMTVDEIAEHAYPILRQANRDRLERLKDHVEDELPTSRIETDRTRLQAAAVNHTLKCLIIRSGNHGSILPLAEQKGSSVSLAGDRTDDGLDSLVRTALAGRIPVHVTDPDILPLGRSACGILRYPRVGL